MPETESKSPQIAAAKKYTRMNARGKRLTDFENLKAIIDEIESNIAADTSVSLNYDKVYLYSLYDFFNEGNLNETVKKINCESFELYRYTYLVYALENKIPVPYDLANSIGSDFPRTESNPDNFENEIYKISQKRKSADSILDYLKKLRNIQEVLYNNGSGKKTTFGAFHFSLDSWKDFFAFAEFASVLWEKKNDEDAQKVFNNNLLNEWYRFNDFLRNMDYSNWEINENEDIDAATYVALVKEISVGVKDFSSNVNDYILGADFSRNGPFAILKNDDICCRIEEQKIKAYLLKNNHIASFSDLDSVMYNDTQRLGYFFYVSGCLDDWEDNQKINQPTIDLLSDFKQLIEITNYKSPDFLKLSAYISQCSHADYSLYPLTTINQCTDSHLWHDECRNWDDQEKSGNLQSKKAGLDNIRNLLNKLIENIKSGCATYDSAYTSYLEEIKSFFSNTSGYENCWLRILINAEKSLSKLLEHPLTFENGCTLIDGKNFILYSYVLENDYGFARKLDLFQTGASKKIYTSNPSEFVLFGKTEKTLSFCPDLQNDTKYKHSTDNRLEDLSNYQRTKNMVLCYSHSIKPKSAYQTNSLLSCETVNKEVTISLLELGISTSNKIEIKSSSTKLTLKDYKFVLDKVDSWAKEFQNLEDWPIQNNYDKWLELWSIEKFGIDNFKFIDGNLPQNALFTTEGRQKPIRKWEDSYILPQTTAWIDNIILY